MNIDSKWKLLLRSYVAIIAIMGAMISYPVYYIMKSIYSEIENYDFRNGIRIKTNNVLVRNTILKNRNDFRESLHREILIYEVYDSKGNKVQDIFGDFTWNTMIPYDINHDGYDDLFISGAPNVNVPRKPSGRACYLFDRNQNKFVFSRIYSREELPLSLDIQLFDLAWLSKIETPLFVIFVLNLLNIVVYAMLKVRKYLLQFRNRTRKT
ncbi:hypothetical protein CH373_06580 [Leptospira perolatii]|uniref:Uncharacterized protein n=1 Tax=Leptospira perolatii TaxID=2023191 RepID=A0A2M9ZPC5_9LEPT|nr:hypothetical protein [Leptospira perolatii]PJZ70607.1 hypothetical protein CH360_03440 [Leptospira perolatii]PJZ73819.1 hypothetical protein CH373_06580 [Leptospira perolatii]